MIKAVLFDMDGVLLNSYEAWYELIEETARRWNYPPIGRRAFRESWGQGPEADAESFFRGRSPEEIAESYNRSLPDHLEGVEVDPAGPRVFQALVTRGLGVAVVTNTPEAGARVLLDHAGLDPMVLVGPTETIRGKPAPDMVQEACRRLGVEPGEAIMVGDSRFDKAAAEGAGVPFVGYRGEQGRWTIHELEEVLDLLDSEGGGSS